MLGHASPKAIEVYAKLIEINNKKITSPLEYLIKNNYISRDKNNLKIFSFKKGAETYKRPTNNIRVNTVLFFRSLKKV